MPQVDHRVGQGFEGVVQFAEAIEAQQQAAELVFPAKTCSMVRKRSLRRAESNNGLRPRLGVFLRRGLGLMLGVMPRLKMALRLVRQPQEVVEDRMQTQFGCRTAMPDDQVGQDKLRKLRQAQMRRNPLPLLVLRHLDRQSERILTPFWIAPKT